DRKDHLSDERRSNKTDSSLLGDRQRRNVPLRFLLVARRWPFRDGGFCYTLLRDQRHVHSYSHDERLWRTDSNNVQHRLCRPAVTRLRAGDLVRWKGIPAIFERDIDPNRPARHDPAPTDQLEA